MGTKEYAKKYRLIQGKVYLKDIKQDDIIKYLQDTNNRKNHRVGLIQAWKQNNGSVSRFDGRDELYPQFVTSQKRSRNDGGYDGYAEDNPAKKREIAEAQERSAKKSALVTY